MGRSQCFIIQMISSTHTETINITFSFLESYNCKLPFCFPGVRMWRGRTDEQKSVILSRSVWKAMLHLAPSATLFFSLLLPQTFATAPDWNQSWEVGTHSRSPMCVTGTQPLNHHLLLLRVYISRKQDLKAEPALKTRYSDTG